MSKFGTPSLSLFAVLVLSLILGPPPAGGQVYTYTTGIPTSCVMTIVKAFYPSMAMPTATVVINKYLDMYRNCSYVDGNNAFCNPGPLAPAPTNTMLLFGSAFGSNITMSPSCSWVCTGCGTITITGGDGLPVELMDFSVE